MTKRWLFIVAAIALAGLGLYYRSQNAKSAHAQVMQILSADTADTDTTTLIGSLKTFVASHMGASVTFTLTQTYNRAKAAADASAAAAAANAQIYAAAQAACSGKTDSITQAKCNEAYIQQHAQTAPAVSSAPPDPTAYKYNLHAPWWTPDLAGALLLGATTALVIGFSPLGTRRWA